jgi:hypothetical protein
MVPPERSIAELETELRARAKARGAELVRHELPGAPSRRFHAGFMLFYDPVSRGTGVIILGASGGDARSAYEALIRADEERPPEKAPDAD